MKRRFTIGLTLALALLLSCKGRIGVPDLVIHNAQVYTVDTATTWAEAVAIKDGKIIEVGSNRNILSLCGKHTRVIDAQGYFMMPGFIEGHGHFAGLGSSLQNLNFLDIDSWDAVVNAVAAKVATVKPGEWITGRGWHQDKWKDPPIPNVLGYPYNDVLSTISPENPVLLKHASGHAILANKAAMDAAGVTQETPDPQGGHIVRGADGTPIGVFEENAQDIIEDAYRQYLTSLSAEELTAKWYAGIRLAENECLKHGVTSFQDAGSSLEEVDRFIKLANSDSLNLRLWLMLLHTPEYLQHKLSGFPKIGIGHDFVTCRALKGYVDGALGSYGAWLLAPYEDNPGFTGQNTTSLDELSKLADLSVANDMQLCIHAIGDRANREVLNLYERKFSEYHLDRGVRWRIEHAQHLSTEDIPRFGKLGVIASMQGIHCTSDAPFVVKRLGEQRARAGAYVWKSLLNSGAVVANGTDTPVESVDPIACFYASVTRRRVDSGFIFFPEQRLTREEAVYSYTMANAYAAFEEDIKGSLQPGKYADLILLSQNLITCADETILKTKVLLTIVNGEIKYQDAGF